MSVLKKLHKKILCSVNHTKNHQTTDDFLLKISGIVGPGDRKVLKKGESIFIFVAIEVYKFSYFISKKFLLI